MIFPKNTDNPPVVHTGGNTDDTPSVRIIRICRCCYQTHIFLLPLEDYTKWAVNRVLIQKALPYLSADERELFISSTCGDCWKIMFNIKEESNGN